jgi:hypothetical protein
MNYLVNGNEYHVSYRELKEAHMAACILNNAEFMEQIQDMLHLACMICFFKEIPNEVCLSDEGIVHQLVHISSGIDGPSVDLVAIRVNFDEILKLS